MHVSGDRAARTRGRDADEAGRTPMFLFLLVLMFCFGGMVGGGGGVTLAFLLDVAILADASTGLPYATGAGTYSSSSSFLLPDFAQTRSLQHYWDPLRGVRVGEASCPGPVAINLFHSLSLNSPPPPIIVDKFGGFKAGMVFTTRDGVTGYFADRPAREGSPETQCDASLQYLRLIDGNGADIKFPLALDGIFSGAFCSADSIKRRCRRFRAPRARRKRKGRVQGPLPDFGGFFDHVHIDDCCHRNLGIFCIDTCNGDNCTGAINFLQQSSADIVCLQELRVAGASADNASRSARRSKWSLAVENASPTDRGSLSAGVGVATRSHIGHANCNQLIWHSDLNGRVRVSFVNSVVKSGLFIISIYLWHTERLSDRNPALLGHLAKILSSMRAPWVIAGDWNLTPTVLDNSGWITLIKGRIHSAGVPTCNLQEYDFFVLDARLSTAAVGVKAISGSGNPLHVPTRLYLRGNARCNMVNVIIAPVKVPAFLPAGCLPQGADNGWDAIAPDDSPSTVSAGGLNRALCNWFDRAESAIADIRSFDSTQAALEVLQKLARRCREGAPGSTFIHPQNAG